jgi:lysine-specific demethylase 3
VRSAFFDQVNILTHTAEVSYETYTLKKTEEIKKKMKQQDLQELYGGLESSTDSRNITVDETSKTSCNEGICEDISDS